MVFNEFYIKIIDFYDKIRIFMKIFKNFGNFFSILDRSPGSLGPFWGALGPPRGPKVKKPDFVKNLIFNKIGFLTPGLVLRAQGPPKWAQGPRGSI